MIAGTPQYMSPEQTRGEPIDSRSDLFSLGSVIYAMCTGHPPFRAETTYGIMRRITDDWPRLMREINPEIPLWLCRLVGKLHAKSVVDRYQSATAVAEVLQQCLAHVQTPNVRLPWELRRSDRLASMTQWKLAGVMSVVLVISAMIGANQGWFSGEDETNLKGGAAVLSSPANESPVATEKELVTQHSMSDADFDWEDVDELSIGAVRTLIEKLDDETRRSFDERPSSK